MREIKFRAWDKIHKEMSTWSSLYDNPNLWEYILSHNEQFENWIGDIVLMQFTGLTDKNGKEIYEGDIILFNNFGDTLDKVVYSPGCFHTSGGGYLLDEIREIEVIGNIYENPELLEENNESR